MNSQLIHIFDNSACLTKRQLKGYVEGSMTNEESHAVEVHLNSCPFCNTAVEGLFAQKEGDLLAVDALSELNTEFLKDHFSITNPQIHLNSMAPATQVHTIGRERKRKTKAQPLVRITSIAAAAILVLGLLWFFDYGKNKIAQNQLAQNTTTAGAASAPVTTAAELQSSAAEGINADNAQTSEPAAIPPQQPGDAPQQTEPQRPQALLMAGKDDKDDQSNATGTQTAPASTKKAITADTDEALVAAAAPAKPENKNAFAASDTRNRAATMSVVAGDEAKKKESANLVNENADVLEEAHELYAQKKYSRALSSFRKEMNSSDNEKRQEATLMAAKCYLNMNNTDKAEQLLNSLVEEGGPQKKAAKKLLRELNRDE